MLTKFTFPNGGRAYSQSVGKETNHPRIEPKQMAKAILFWGDLYTIVYNFLGAEIDSFEAAKAYFIEHIDFDCLIECKDNKINLSNAFYFYFD